MLNGEAVALSLRIVCLFSRCSFTLGRDNRCYFIFLSKFNFLTKVYHKKLICQGGSIDGMEFKINPKRKYQKPFLFFEFLIFFFLFFFVFFLLSHCFSK